MNNLFFRTTLAPYRIDLYNSLHKNFQMEFFFYRRIDFSQNINMDLLEQQCDFTPNYLKGIELGGSSRKLCTGIFKILKNANPDFVIVPEFQLILIQIWLFRVFFRKKFKIISMCDDSYDMIVNDNNFTHIHKYAQKILTPLLDNIIVVEPKVMEWYQKKYNIGIWFPIIRDEKIERKNYNRVLPISNQINEKHNLYNKKIIMFVGRLVALKNLSRFLKAVEKIKEDCSVVIIGSGEEELMLKQQAENINKEIIFTGRLEGDELRAWYNVSDIFVLLSTQESFGAVTNEALLAGNHVIVSKKAGSNCLVEENINGNIVDPFDIDMIADRMDKLLIKIGAKSNEIKLKPNLMNVSFHERMLNLENQI